ncbi:MAG: DUF3160 domain-containing protein [Chloroflexota bacterium]
MYQLTPAQREYVVRNGFVVVPSMAFGSMAEAYQQLKDRPLPILVTTDALLHTAHLFFDNLLRIVEITTLRARLVGLIRVLLDASARDVAQADDPAVREAARRNLAFFSVGARLLEPSHQVAADVADLVDAELQLIRERTTGVPLPKSQVLGIREDYSQYIPRGHYTRNDDLRTYFLAVMWYGRMGFFLCPSESHALSQADIERLARQALLITRYLYHERVGEVSALDVWRGIYETTALFAGRAEDPGPDAYACLAREVWGDLPGVNQLAGGERLAAFLTQARQQLPRPGVLSTYYLTDDTLTPRWQDGTLGFRFLSQRFVPDTHILSELVWDRVGRYLGRGEPFTLYVSMYDGPYRGAPRGLDVLAAFGSELAERILHDEGDTEYGGYAEKLAGLKARYAQADSEPDLYHRWLGVFRELLVLPPETAPTFMRNQAWARKQLNAALGSWAELRHDTMLYIKQSYTSTPRGAAFEAPPPSPAAYVEPCPQVYRRLGALITHLRQGLDGWGMIEAGVRAKLTEFEALLSELSDIAARELQGRWPDASETKDLSAIGARLKGLLRWPQELVAQISSSADDRMAIVADVHTHLEGGVVLEEAVGDPFLICVELEREGRRVLYWGAVFSYYEFKQPLNDRLTDEAWQVMWPKPPLPPWTRLFLALE